jgi:hypothetical protein
MPISNTAARVSAQRCICRFDQQAACLNRASAGLDPARAPRADHARAALRPQGADGADHLRAGAAVSAGQSLRRQPTGAILPAEHTGSAEAPVKDIATLQELVDSAAEGTLPHGWSPPGSPMDVAQLQ